MVNFETEIKEEYFAKDKDNNDFCLEENMMDFEADFNKKETKEFSILFEESEKSVNKILFLSRF